MLLMSMGSWLLPVSLTITIAFGIVVCILSVCWWLILKRTVKTFNTERKRDHHD